MTEACIVCGIERGRQLRDLCWENIKALGLEALFVSHAIRRSQLHSWRPVGGIELARLSSPTDLYGREVVDG